MVVKSSKLRRMMFTAAFATFTSYNVCHASSDEFFPEASSTDRINTSISLTAEETILTGQFLHTPTQGVRYTTATQAGITDANGHFQYLEGEVVSFFIGGLLLGEATGNSNVSIFDLVEGADAVTGNALRQSIDKSIPFNRVINIATLLQTLDRDNNAENGVTLTLPVTRLFEADSVHFDKRWDKFKADLGLRSALAAGKSAGLIHNAVQIRQPWRALRQVYQELGVEVLLRPYSRTIETEGELSTEVEYAYDSEGLQIQAQEYDSHGNQTLNYYKLIILFTEFTAPVFYQYDSNGNLSRVQTSPELSNFGFPYYDIAYQYNDLGQRLLMLVSSNDEPVSNAIKYEYNSKGSLTRLTEDSNGDGLTNKTTRFRYDTHDQIILKQEDSDFDGTTDLTTASAYDQSGNMIRQEVTETIEGEIIAVSMDVFFYNANGSIVRKELYSDGNDLPDTSHQYGYDANGNLILEESFDAEGLYQTQSYEYDLNDNLTHKMIDKDGDGFNDVNITYELAADVEPWWTLFPNASTPEIILGGSVNKWMLLLLSAMGALRLVRKSEGSITNR